MKTIIYHHRTQGTDAQGIHINEMCRAFGKIGLKVKKISVFNKEAVGKESRDNLLTKIIEKIPGIAYEFMEISYNIFGFFNLLIATKRYSPYFIYERYSIYNISGILVSKLTKIPIIVEINAPLAAEKAKYGKLYFKKLGQHVETWVANNATYSAVVTSALRDIYIRNGASQAKFIVTPNGVNLDEFEMSSDDIGNTLNPVHKTNETLTLGFVGWFRKWHGLEEMIQIFFDRGFFNKYPIKLLLVGDGPTRKDIEELIHRLEINHLVTITGALDRKKVIKLLYNMDIALQPSVTEYACPMKIIEYMASGRAIIAPNQKNIRELLSDKENSLLFSPGNWQDLAKKVEILIQQDLLRKTIAANAQKSVSERPLTWDANAKEIISILSNNID